MQWPAALPQRFTNAGKFVLACQACYEQKPSPACSSGSPQVDSGQTCWRVTVVDKNAS